MIVYMLESTRGSPDGFAVKRYMQGCHYDVPQMMGAAFINHGIAIAIPNEDVHDRINGVKLSSNMTLHTLPNPHMNGFNANSEARKAEGI